MGIKNGLFFYLWVKKCFFTAAKLFIKDHNKINVAENFNHVKTNSSKGQFKAKLITAEVFFSCIFMKRSHLPFVVFLQPEVRRSIFWGHGETACVLTQRRAGQEEVTS